MNNLYAYVNNILYFFTFFLIALLRLVLSLPIPQKIKLVIYVLIKKIVFSPLLINSWNENGIKVKNRYGFYMQLDPRQHVERTILFFGEWEPDITRQMIDRIKPGDIVIDIGANVGYYTLLAAKMVGPKGKVYAVEASPKTLKKLRTNIKCNDFKNIEILPYGAWNCNTEKTFYCNILNLGVSSIAQLQPVQNGYYEAETIEMRRIEELIPKDEYSAVSLIKMDVEGSEFYALEGLSSILSQKNISVFLEYNPMLLEKLDIAGIDLFQLLKKYEFTLYSLNNDYSVNGYISRIFNSPQILTEPPTDQIDILGVKVNG